MNIKEYKAEQYRCLNFLGAAEKALQTQALTYIERLATVSQTPIDEWNIKEIFGTGDGLKIVTEKAEINRKLFEAREKMAKSTPSLDLSMPRQLQAAVELLQSAERKRLARRNQRDVTRLTADIDSMHRDLRTRAQKLRQAVEKQKAIETVGLMPEPLDELRKVLAQGVWDFWTVNHQGMQVVSKVDCVARHVMPSAGVNRTINFGRFRVVIGWDGQITVKPHQNNLYSDRAIHPHVYAEGGVCFGDASGRVALMIAQGETAQVMGVLWEVLSNPNNGSPIVAIEHYYNAPIFNPNTPGSRESQQLDFTGVLAKISCNYCGRIPSSCNCVEGSFLMSFVERRDISLAEMNQYIDLSPTAEPLPSPGLRSSSGGVFYTTVEAARPTPFEAYEDDESGHEEEEPDEEPDEEPEEELEEEEATDAAF